MHIEIRHETRYDYESAPSYVIQTLRMTPSPHEGQHVRRWRIDVDSDVHLSESRDGFGNLLHTFSVANPIDSLTIVVEGVVETVDMAGIVRGTREPFVPALFLRRTNLTRPDADIETFARDEAKGTDDLERLHALMAAIHARLRFDTDPTHVGTSAREAFAARSGVCQDYSHIMIAAARAIGIPARYVGGYFRRADDIDVQNAGHAWIEAFAGTELGWVGFDPANCICTTEQHVRVASGLDYQDAAPVRGTRYGGDSEDMTVSLRVDQGRRSSAQ